MSFLISSSSSSTSMNVPHDLSLIHLYINSLSSFNKHFLFSNKKVYVLPLELPKRPLTWRAYATTALAHLLISAFNLLESMSFKDFPGSRDTSTEEKHRSNRRRFTVLSALPPLTDRDFLTDMVGEGRAAARIVQEKIVFGTKQNLVLIYKV